MQIQNVSKTFQIWKSSHFRGYRYAPNNLSILSKRIKPNVSSKAFRPVSLYIRTNLSMLILIDINYRAGNITISINLTGFEIPGINCGNTSF